jgi:hypothetical protein
MALLTSPSWTPGFELAEAGVSNSALVEIAADLIKDTTEDTPSSRKSQAAFQATKEELLRDYEFNFAQRRMTIPEDADFGYKGLWEYAYKLEPPTASYATIGTTTTSKVLTGFTGLTVNSLRGFRVSGTGIPTGARVVSNDATTVTLNIAATATGSVTIAMSLAVIKVLEVGNVRDNLFEVIGEGPNRRLLCNVTSGESPNLLPVKYVEDVIDPDYWDALFRHAFALRLASKLAISLLKDGNLALAKQSEFAAIFTLAKNASSKEKQVDEGEEFWTRR